MKTIILAGGMGTRISEESHLRPKPMIEIGDRPIIWHIMKYYSSFGFNDFIICLGYKGHIIKQFFADYYLHMSDITFDFTAENNAIIHQNIAEPWKVTLVDTGLHTQTGGRIARVKDYLENEPFMLTYGDGLSDVDLNQLIKHHQEQQKIVTLTAVQPGGRFGVLKIDEQTNQLTGFLEKSKEDGGWINGGFMVLSPQIFNYLDGDSCVFEDAPMRTLAQNGQSAAYKHNGFWQCMDTQRDKDTLTKAWESDKAPWKIW